MDDVGTGPSALGSAVSQQEWETVEYGDGDSLVIHYAGTDDRVCFMATPGERGSAERILANAHLIAAAPDLYAAAKALEDDRDEDNLEDIKAKWRKLRAAVAKAEGRSAQSSSREAAVTKP